MIGALLFLVVLGGVIFKMVYDHQLVKELKKMGMIQDETDEGN